MHIDVQVSNKQLLGLVLVLVLVAAVGYAQSYGSGSPTIIGHTWNELDGIPAYLADGDNDLLAGMSCAEGQTLKVSGGAWTCATDTRCDTSGTCSQVCIGTDCKTSWPIEAYDTGWIPRSNWKTVQLGSSTTKNANSNVAHNLNAPLAQLLIKVLVSSDGTDANSFEVTPSADAFYVSGNYHYGITIYQVDMNNIKLQTGINGISIVNDAPYTGYIIQLDTEDWYYKVKVWKLE